MARGLGLGLYRVRVRVRVRVAVFIGSEPHFSVAGACDDASNLPANNYRAERYGSTSRCLATAVSQVRVRDRDRVRV